MSFVPTTETDGSATETCEACGAALRQAARYCPNCGQQAAGNSKSPQAPRGPVHPNPLRPPPEMSPVAAAMDVFYQFNSAWGGSRLGSESLSLGVLSCGHSLEAVVLEISGVGGRDQAPFRIRQEIERLPRGDKVRVEVPSYELPDEPRELSVTLVSADVNRNTA